jgi:hypothetical protein
VAYLFRLQKRFLVEHKKALARHQTEMAQHKACKREAGREGDADGPPQEPLLKQVICSDITIEKLAEVLADNPRGTLVARDELAGWLGSFTRYKGKQGGSDLPNWLEMHRAGTVKVDRKTGDRRTIFVPCAATSVTGGIQPGVLARALTDDFLDAGLIARLLLAMPPKLPKRWLETEVEPEVEKAYQDVLDRLFNLELDRDEQGEPVPFALRLSPEAKSAWVDFYNEWAQRQAAAEGEIAAAYSKLEAYAARFALLHHVVSRVARGEDDSDPVEPTSVEAGAALCRWFAAEAGRIYSTLSQSAEEREARRLVEFVRARGGTLKPRELMRGNCRKYPTTEAAEAALDVLVQSGLGEWVEQLTGERGGRPTRHFRLRMTHDTTDKTPDGVDDGDDVDGYPAHDNGADTTQPGSKNQAENRGFVSCVMRHAESNGIPEPGEPGTGAEQPGSGQGKVLSYDGDDDNLIFPTFPD